MSKTPKNDEKEEKDDKCDCDIRKSKKHFKQPGTDPRTKEPRTQGPENPRTREPKDPRTQGYKDDKNTKDEKKPIGIIELEGINASTQDRMKNKESRNCQVEEFTFKELEKAIDQLKAGKAKDNSGLIAEMIECGGDQLTFVLLGMYNEILKHDGEPPTTWKKTLITVLYKAGNPEIPSNYRPIACIPLLYKLFSRMLYNRLETVLDPQQSPAQAGFRRGFCTEDHLFTLTSIQEKAEEWSHDIWIAALDFKKVTRIYGRRCAGKEFQSHTSS